MTDLDVPAYAFDYCKEIECVDIPDGANIHTNAFEECGKLINICGDRSAFVAGKLENGVFWGCKKLRSNIKLTDLDVPAYAFDNCKEIERVEVPDGANIQINAFENCVKLKSICGNRPLFVAGRLEGSAFSGCRVLAVAIRITEKIVRNYVFYDCQRLEKVIVPPDVKIEEYAFKLCYAKPLTFMGEENEDVVSESTLDSLDYSVEDSIIDSDEVYMRKINPIKEIQANEDTEDDDTRTENGLVICGKVLVEYNGDEDKVVIPNDVKIIGREAFSGNNTIKSVILPNGVLIEEDAFMDCSNLEEVTERGNVLTLGRLEDGAFWGCENLRTKLRLTDLLVPSNVFSGCENIVSVEIPDGADIYINAFESCKKLKSICGDRAFWVAGQLGKGAFWGCEALRTKIRLTDRYVRTGTFSYCKELESVEIPSGAEIHDSAFEECEGLKTITKGDEVLTIEHLENGAFWGCKKLRTKLKLTELQVPSYAFGYCSELESVEVPAGANILKNAFEECVGLKKITEGDEILTLGKVEDCAFWECNELRTKIKLTDSLIPENAFNNCKMLQLVEVPEGTVINELTFEGCERLKVICSGRVIWSVNNTDIQQREVIYAETENYLQVRTTGNISESQGKSDIQEPDSDTDFYQSFVGKDVIHKIFGYGIVRTCDGECIGIEFQRTAGKVSLLALEICLSKGLIEFI